MTKEKNDFGKIRSIDITEFRGIKKLKKPLKLEDLTVLIGRNNSGKSSILEALYLFPNPSYANTPYKNNRLSIITELHSGFDSLVYGYSGKAKIKYEILGGEFPLLNIDLTIDEDAKVIIDYGNIEDPELNNKLNIAFNSNVENRDFSFFIPNDTNILDKLENISKKIENKIVKEGSHLKAVKLVNNYTNDQYTEILFANGLRARKELENNYLYIYLKDLGDGIEKIIKLILWIETINPKIILWDDFETTAHPSLIKAILEYLLEKNIQIILSTHSIDVLYILTEIKPKKSIILQLSKTKDDVLDYESLTVNQIEDLIDASQDPRLLDKKLGL